LIIMKQKNVITSGSYIMIKIKAGTGIDLVANWDQVFGILRGVYMGEH
ncbi:21525_t:CDS:2, partial [Racocetra persica]